MATKKKSSSIKVPAQKKTASTKAKASSKTKVSTKAIPVPHGREHKLAEQALKLVDEASSILRNGIRGSAATTAKSRIAAKKKANDLLGKASHNLTKALAESTAALQKLIEKI